MIRVFNDKIQLGNAAARQAADAIQRAVQRVEAARKSALSAGSQARSEALRAIRDAHEQVLQAPELSLPPEPEVAGELRVGGRVRVRSLGVEHFGQAGAIPDLFRHYGIDADAIIVDIHAEATSEKQTMGHFCDGRASLVIGTHTHAPTADHQILPQGTAFMSDVGMTGDYDSVIGMDKNEPLARFLRKIPNARFEPALGAATLCALAVETDDATGLARRVGAVRLGGRLEEARPKFWE